MIETTPLSRAWKIFQSELQAVCGDNFTEEDYLDDPDKRVLAHEVEKGVITARVLDEIESCLTRSWCTGRVKTAALTVLAAHGRLEEFDPNATRTRRPTTHVILGKRYIV